MIEVFRSPQTHHQLTLKDNYYTSDLNEKFPIYNEIPLLVKDWKEQEKLIHSYSDTLKKEWYSKTQYDSYHYGPYRHHYSNRKKHVQKTLRETFLKIQSPCTILDQGCGDGLSSLWISEILSENDHFYLTDYNIERVYRAKNLMKDKKHQFFLSDATNSPIISGSFDIVFSNHVIEHIYNDHIYFSEISRILKPNGYLLLGCPNEGVLWWMLAYAMNPKFIRNTDHVHFYNIDSILHIAKQYDFQLKSKKHLGFGPPNWYLDAFLRQFKIFESFFEYIGKLFKNQNNCLYILLKKNENNN